MEVVRITPSLLRVPRAEGGVVHQAGTVVMREGVPTIFQIQTNLHPPTTTRTTTRATTTHLISKVAMAVEGGGILRTNPPRSNSNHGTREGEVGGCHSLIRSDVHSIAPTVHHGPATPINNNSSPIREIGSQQTRTDISNHDPHPIHSPDLHQLPHTITTTPTATNTNTNINPM